MEIYNVQPVSIDIRIIKGDTFNMMFLVSLNGASYSMTGKQVDIKIKRFDGTLVKSLSSAGVSPAIVIDDDYYVINSTGFTEAETLKYDVQITAGTDILTIQTGRIIVSDEITTAT